MNKKISQKDKKDWETFIESNEKIIDKDFDLQSNKKKNVEKTIDLHGYSLENANKTIEEFIEEAALCNMIKNYFKNPFFEHFLPQWKYIYDSNNNLMIDALFYQEKYHNIDTFLKEKFNCHSTTSFEIGNQHKPILTKENKRKIFLIYKKDFELLGYNKTFQQ